MSCQAFALRMWALVPCSRVIITRKARTFLDNVKAAFSNLWATEWLGITVPMV
jgi:hypothetical protein